MERVVWFQRRFEASLTLFLCVLIGLSAFAADIPVVPPFPLSQRGIILAEELSRQWTRDARQLVAVLEQAVDEEPNSPPLTFLLAVAHAETNGKILIVSEAGAVGLAQATPSAYLREGGRGKLFVTPDYVAGSLAYILKKPLGDADTIATMVVEDSSDAAWAEARTLLHAAFKFRREGVDELMLLQPYGGSAFIVELHEQDRHNLEVLQELETLLDHCASPLEMSLFQVRVREQYETLKLMQRFYWRRYQADLVSARDRLLRRAFQKEPKTILAQYAYQAAELAARELDDRFSPWSMARFLRDHLVTKMDQAYELGIPEQELERVTAGLYNGGSHNVLRMRTGLIRNLPETDNYMRKVPAMKARLDDALAAALPTDEDAGTR